MSCAFFSASLPDWLTGVGTICLGCTAFRALGEWIKPEISNAKKEIIKNIVLLDYHLNGTRKQAITSTVPDVPDDIRQQREDLFVNLESSITYLLWLLDKEANQELREAIQGLRKDVFQHSAIVAVVKFREHSAKLMELIKKMK